MLAVASVNGQTNTSGVWQYTVSNSEATITGYTGSGGAVTIPSTLNGISVKRVGNGSTPVFGNPNTNVTSITVPDNVTNIGAWAFTCCTKLLLVLVPDGLRFETTADPVFDAHTTVIYPSLLRAFATNDVFITAVANKIRGTGGNYGLATQSGVSSTISTATFGLVTQSQITTLATKGELTNALAQIRPNGKFDLNYTFNRDGWSLISTNDLLVSPFAYLILHHTTEGDPAFNFEIQQSDDMQNWITYEEYDQPPTLPTNKAFVRIRPRQLVTNIELHEAIGRTLSVVNTIKSAASNYYARYGPFPQDGLKLATDLGSTNSWTRTYGDLSTVSTNTTTFGDLLLSEGLLDHLRMPIGASGYSNAVTYTASSISLSQDGVGRTTPVNAGAINYPLVLCRVAPDTSFFTASSVASSTVFMLIPGLSSAQAASLKTRIDGHFGNSIASGQELVAKAIAGNSTNNLINLGNCRLTPSPLASGSYDAWCYIGND